MENNEFYKQFPTLDAALNSYRSNASYQKLSPVEQQQGLERVRREYNVAYAANRTPSRGSVDGEVKPPVEQPDLAGRVRSAAMSATERGPMAEKTRSFLPDPLHALASLLPSDNAQAFIDAALAGLSFTGIGELGMASRMALTTATTTAAGTAGGYTSGTPGSGGAKGFLEGAGGSMLEMGARGAITAGRGTYLWLTRKAKQAAVQSEDLAWLEGWLGERYPAAVAKLKSVGDFAKLFRQGGLMRHADGEMTKLNTEAGDTLASASAKKVGQAPTGPAKVVSPTQQATEQEAALKAVGGGRPSPAQEAGTAAPKVDVADAQKRLAKVEQSIADAKARGAGQRELDALQQRADELRSKIPTTPEENLARMRQGALGKTPEERASAVFDEVGQPPKMKGSGPKYAADFDEKLSAYQSKLPPRGAAAPKRAPTTPEIRVQGVPKQLMDKWNMARNIDLSAKWDLATEVLDEVEKRGWDLSGHAPLKHAAAGARAGALQMEQYIGDQLAKEDAGMASKWLQGRQNQRVARVLTKLFNNDGAIDENGHFIAQVIQDDAKNYEVFADLEAAMGTDEATRFINEGIFRNAPGGPTATDIAGKAPSVTASMHPGLPPGIRAWMHKGKIPSYVGLDHVPYQLGYGRALTAALVLGPDRFVQMMKDLTETGDLTNAANAK